MTITFHLWWVIPIISIISGFSIAELIWRFARIDEWFKPSVWFVVAMFGTLLGIGAFIGHFL
jgi:predicted membrane-bound spermidine synthase